MKTYRAELERLVLSVAIAVRTEASQWRSSLGKKRLWVLQSNPRQNRGMFDDMSILYHPRIVEVEDSYNHLKSALSHRIDKEEEGWRQLDSVVSSLQAVE